LTSPTGGIAARALGLRTRSGWVYRDVDLDVPDGSLTVVTGPARSGKTALLLTLAGRMRAGEGDLTVAGIDARRRPDAVRRVAGLGEFRGVNDLDETLSVGDQIMAELALHGRHWRGEHADAVLRPLCPTLDTSTTVRDLSAVDRILLGAALGCIGSPPLLFIDELDEATTPKETGAVLDALRWLIGTGVTVVAGALDSGLSIAADVTLALTADASPAGALPLKEVTVDALV
jgi:ABC-type multidrug transport system ATPase subunit